MTDFQITHVRKNSNDVITDVKIGSSRFAVRTVVGWLLDKTDTVFTMKNGYRATVYPRKHWSTHRWFLTTIPDGSVENNLDFLPTF